MDISKLKTIVFSGGGVRGLAYVGILMAFQDTYKKSAHDHFSTFVGTSVGALFALVCAIDADVAKSLEAFESIGLESIFDKDPTWLLTNYALNSAKPVRELLITLLASRGLKPDITMLELYRHTRKTLTVTTVDLLTTSTLYLNHTNEGASMPVVSVLLGSMALPPMFPPETYVGPTRTFQMIDGGLVDNFPIANYEKETTLGLRTSWFISPQSPMSDINAYYTRVLAVLQLTMYSVQNAVSDVYPYSVYVDVGPIKADDSAVDIRELVFKGYRAAVARFLVNVAPTNSAQDQPTKYLSDKPVPLPEYIRLIHKSV